MQTKRRKSYFVYILSSINKVIYVGFTDGLVKRISQHKKGFYVNAFTKKYHVTRLIYWEKYDTKEVALAREKELKGWRREKKIDLIEKQNPQWHDVYPEVIELYKAFSSRL